MGSYLMHFGVKGMRWGVRRKRNRILTAKAKARRRNPSEMSDAELDNAILRMQREKRYKQLAGQRNPGGIAKSAISREAKTVLRTTGEQLASEYLRKAVKNGIKRAGERRRSA